MLFSFLLWTGEDHSLNRPGSSSRLASVGRLITPRSPGGNAFGNAEDSDEEGTELANEDDIIFSHETVDASSNIINVGSSVVLASYLMLNMLTVYICIFTPAPYKYRN